MLSDKINNTNDFINKSTLVRGGGGGGGGGDQRLGHDGVAHAHIVVLSHARSRLRRRRRRRRRRCWWWQR